MTDNLLALAFAYHHRLATRRYVNANAARLGVAVWAMQQARKDIAEGVKRYPPELRKTWRDESDGLRLIGRVMPEAGGRHGLWDSRGDCGWHTDPFGDVFRDGTGLCYGLVYQLPGRRGESRFVAGYQFGGCDGGPTLDLTRVYTDPRGDYYATPTDLQGARDAAYAADSLAKDAAEKEHEYQTAWRAGSDYAQAGEEMESAQAELRDILKERRAVKGAGEYPALCRALRPRVASLWGDIQDARKRRKELAEGDAPDLYFWPGDARLRDAFAEGAGLDTFPA